MKKEFTFLALVLLARGGCASTQKVQTSNNIAVFTNSQANLKVAEIPPTAISGKNYQYCYGCVVYNYKNFDAISGSTNAVSNQIMGAISSQFVKQNDFKTDLNYVPADSQTPELVVDQTSLSTLQGGS